MHGKGTRTFSFLLPPAIFQNTRYPRAASISAAARCPELKAP